MNCPFLSGNYFFSCKSSREVYVPSAFELEEYCESTRHTICQYYHCDTVASNGVRNCTVTRVVEQGCRSAK